MGKRVTFPTPAYLITAVGKEDVISDVPEHG